MRYLPLLLLAFAGLSCSDGGINTGDGDVPPPGGQAPVIVRIVPESAHRGEVLSIYGTRLTGSGGISSVTIGGSVTTPTRWLDTLIVVTIPGDAASGLVEIIVNGVRSNAATFSLLVGPPPSTPVISSISAPAAMVGERIIVRGMGFGSGLGNSEVLCGGLPTVIVAWSDTLIEFSVPDWVGEWDVVVRVNGRSSNSVRLAITAPPPEIVQLSPVSGAPGSAVTIDGRWFGTATGTVSFNQVAAPITTWTDVRITVTVPSNATSGPVVVNTSRGQSNAIHFSVLSGTPPPSITSLSPDNGPAGTSVVVSGSNFGSGSGTVTFNGVAAQVLSWSSTSIATTVPAGASSGNVIVSLNGQNSNGVFFQVTTSGPAPIITEVRPDPANIGDRLRIHGTNFGPEVPVVTFSGVQGALDEWRSDEIRVYVPAGAVTGPMIVRCGNRSSVPYQLTITGTNPSGIVLSPASVSLTPGNSTTVNISGGTGTYTVQSQPNSGVATATLSGTSLTVTAAGNGQTSVVIADNAPVPSTATLAITVSATGISFAQDVQPIFNARCTSCHGGSAGLYLTPTQSYSNLVNVPAQAGCTTEQRVLPGNAQASVLHKRISGAACGDQMPRGQTPLSAADIQKIADWINQGALNN